MCLLVNPRGDKLSPQLQTRALPALSRIPLIPYWASRQAYKIGAQKIFIVRIRRISRRMRTSYAQLRSQALLSPVGPGVRHDTQGSSQRWPHANPPKRAPIPPPPVCARVVQIIGQQRLQHSHTHGPAGAAMYLLRAGAARRLHFLAGL